MAVTYCSTTEVWAYDDLVRFWHLTRPNLPGVIVPCLVVTARATLPVPYEEYLEVRKPLDFEYYIYRSATRTFTRRWVYTQALADWRSRARRALFVHVATYGAGSANNPDISVVPQV